MKDLTAWRPRSAAHRLHRQLVHRLRRNIISQRIGRGPYRARVIHLEGIGATPHALPAHHLAASNLDLDDLTSTLNLFDAGHVNG
ncbi:hypothetical protein [Hyphomicrobium sp.]|uniref:hypothetical protein n=1 Tax=Hyphomicrobium sp. TaxID=82 RepID=UPI001E08D6EC|nr:hypothetical protein [Hyphomicrobium sp.]MBY0561052.1 hypothetical protein [Hyphomicrobium sp.]